MPRYNLSSRSQINQRAGAIRRHIESQIKIRTNNGRRVITKQEIEHLMKGAARRLEF